MKCLPIPLVALLLLTSVVFAADEVKTAKVLAVKAYPQGRLAYWEGRVPIYDGYPLYDITLRLGKMKYVVRYESLTGYYPANWKAGRDIQVRLQGKRKMYLLNGEEEVLAQIYNGHLQDCVPASGRPTTISPGAQVPCD